jgi:hypothetical protein
MFKKKLVHCLASFFGKTCKQGDQIVRIFAYLKIVSFSQLYDKYSSSSKIWATYFQVRVKILKNGLCYVL